MRKARNKYVTDIGPYTHKNIETAIRHLENLLNAEGANSVFAKSHLRQRVLQACAIRGTDTCIKAPPAAIA